MIYYKSNFSWFNDIAHLFRSHTIKKLVLISLGMMGMAFILYLLKNQFLVGWRWEFGTMLISILGIVLSILLVFRTNSAYERWWEGRIQWGGLVNHSRNLAIACQSTFPAEDQASRLRMAQLISNFCIAIKEHLRTGPKLEELMDLEPREREEYLKRQHLPNFISLQIHELIVKKHRSGEISSYDHRNIKPHTQALLDILGACERIKKTPIPFSYTVFLKISISTYLLLLPWIMIPALNLWAIPLLGLLTFAFVGLELIAEEIEDPFGLQCNALPTGSIALTIRNNVYEILDTKKAFPVQVHKDYEKVF